MRPLSLALCATVVLAVLCPFQNTAFGGETPVYDPAELKLDKVLWILPLNDLTSTARAEWGKIDGKDLFVLDSKHALHCIDLTQGTHRWVLDLRGAPSFEPAIYPDLVGVTVKDRVVIARRSNGSRIMDKRIEFSPCTSPACTEDVFFVASLYKERIAAIDVGSGIPGWTFRFRKAVTAAPKLYGTGTSLFLYVVAHDGTITCLAPKRAGDMGPKRPAWIYKANGRNVADPVLDNDLLFVASQDGSLYALNRLSGAVKWRFYAGAPLSAAPQVIGDKLFLDSDGSLYCLNRSDGNELWKHEGFNTAAAVVGKTAYLWSEAGQLMLVMADTGKEIRKVEANGVIGVIPNPDPQSGILLFSDGGKIHAFK